MNRKYYADAQGATCADEHLTRMVNTDENDLQRQDTTKHSIKITFPEAVWTVGVEPDKDIKGMVAVTFTAKSSAEPLSCEVSSCSISDLESVIRRNLSQVAVEDKRGTLESWIEYLVNRDETETERCAREILCRLFNINC